MELLTRIASLSASPIFEQVGFMERLRTTAGPYVTNISSDGRNGLNIEKCAVKMNAFMGTVSTSECTSQNVQLSRGN